MTGAMLEHMLQRTHTHPIIGGLLRTWRGPKVLPGTALLHMLPLPAPLLAILPILMLAKAGHANNIAVANTSLATTTGTTATIQFDITWENSWRGDGVINWDAAWVFIKFKQSNGVWRHAQLAESGHTAPAGSLIDTGLLTPTAAYHATTNPVLGIFIRRDADGRGTFAANGVQLLWDHGAQGIVTVNDILEVRVFAIEMVYVNEGPFWLGDGVSPDSFHTSGTADPYQVNSEDDPIGLNLGLPLSYPKGYRAFYCMKYEITQQQYADFLNCLTRVQQNARVWTDIAPGVSSVTNRYVMRNDPSIQQRSVIRCDATIDPQAPVHFYCDANGNGMGGEADDGQWIVANYLNSADVAAYLDWSGQRLMTEMEYEKACRGPLYPVPGEFAWGNAQAMTYFTHELEHENTAQEGVVAGYYTNAGNARHTVLGPLRAGIFAAHPANTGRMTSGGGYYGAMELALSVCELTVNSHHPDGFFYTGKHGNGELTGVGVPDVATWPLPHQGNGYIIRGGGGPNADYAPVSARAPAFSFEDYAVTRKWDTGGRGVRTAP